MADMSSERDSFPTNAMIVFVLKSGRYVQSVQDEFTKEESDKARSEITDLITDWKPGSAGHLSMDTTHGWAVVPLSEIEQVKFVRTGGSVGA